MILSMSTPPPCYAQPGWYCTSSGPLLCPENWYCPGLYRPPQQCPSGKWAAVGSMYVEDCSDHMNTELVVVIVLLLMLCSLSLCCWWTSADWLPCCYTSYPSATVLQVPECKPLINYRPSTVPCAPNHNMMMWHVVPNGVAYSSRP